MLIYSSGFTFEPARGPQQIIDCFARWAGLRANRSSVDSSILARGVRELRLKDGSKLTSRVTLNGEMRPAYPYMFCAQLSHGDNQVSGRRWITEMGLRQEALDAPVDCTFLLKTDEISARVTAPIQVSRPKLVEQLVRQCKPSGSTPGLRVKRLDEESAAAFLFEVERVERLHPIVVVSSDREGVYPVAAERLQSLLAGIADIVEVPVGANTFKIEETLGRRYGAWGGAINILFPIRKGGRGPFCETVLYRPGDLAALLEDDKSIESEVLASVTHRTNLPNSWRHISLEVVGHVILRGQLARSIQSAKQNDEAAEYVELLEEADRELRAKDDEVTALRIDLEDREGEAIRFRYEIDRLKYALSGRQSSDVDIKDVSALRPLRELVADVLTGVPTLEQSLKLFRLLFSDRVVVLDTAMDAAHESDRAGFRHHKRAFHLLWKLVNGYWQALAAGKGTQQAKSVFGRNAYAQHESQALSNDGKRRRTFVYRGCDFVMEKHLKIGVKDSAAETLRVHFCWVDEERRLVIGHCGKHLDF